jgi:hypothetical protein
MLKNLNSNDILDLNRGWVLFHRQNNETKECFLFNMEDGTQLSLNTTAWDMLNLLDHTKNCQQIVEALSDTYIIENHFVLNDIMKFFDALFEKKVLMKANI